MRAVPARETIVYPFNPGSERHAMPFAAIPIQSPIMPIDLTGLLAVFMGLSIVLIPVIGLTARFALKPTVEALSRFFDKKGSDESYLLLERRMALIEAHIDSIESNVSRLVEVSEFHHELKSGDPTPGAEPAGDEEAAPGPEAP